MREYTHAKIDVVHLEEDIVLASGSENIPGSSSGTGP